MIIDFCRRVDFLGKEETDWRQDMRGKIEQPAAWQDQKITYAGT